MRMWRKLARPRARVGTYVQHVLLDDGVHDDGHQHVEKDGGQVFDAVVEVIDGSLLGAFLARKTQTHPDDYLTSRLYKP